MIKKNTHKGYTLLFAVLTAVLVLGIAAFVAGVARKQYIISSTARDSVYSLYAADSGIECVVQAGVSNMVPPAGGPIPCAGAPTIVSITFPTVTWYAGVPAALDKNQTIYQARDSSTGLYYITLPIIYTDAEGTNIAECVVMKIWKGTDAYNSSVSRTVIESRGYSVCDTSNNNTFGPSQSSRNVERAIRLTQ